MLFPHDQPLLTLLFLGLLTFSLPLLPGELTIDDACITFRYSRNLLAGDEFLAVYKRVERMPKGC
ncbi:MAG: hypothetical protein EPO32_13560 [Anaerolineae bacterium]|nr:MAG: hypothetical protein EPO32_13560 [Anaerolineae bacterium]